MRQSLIAAVLICSAAAGLRGENDVRFVDGDLRFWNRQFEIWGAQVPDWRRVATDPQAVRDTFQVLAERGVNTIGVALQGEGEGANFFAHDGRAADPATAKRFTQLTGHVRDHALACVISLFSSDRSCWLESEAAYGQAVRTAADLLSVKHTTVFVVGDLFGGGRWSPECPYPMGDATRVIELCRALKQAKPECVVGIPGNILRKNAAKPPTSGPFFYFADSPDDLKPLVDRSASGDASAALPRGVVCVEATQFFRLIHPDPSDGKALDKYLHDVETKRLAVRPRLQPAATAPAIELLTPEEKADGFVPLFNGHDLDGWTTLRNDWATWSVEDGCIKCSGADGQWLRSRKRFASFILRFEFKIVSGGNSGVFVWSPLEARSSRFGMEMQIMGVHKDKPDNDTTGAIYDVRPPEVNPDFRINDWNSVGIMCRGSKVRITLNDRVIQDFDADQVPKLKGRLRRGVVGLQDHASPVWFRKIRIKDLEATP
jgi:hypothetical protein